jgi:hypothetical protein
VGGPAVEFDPGRALAVARVEVVAPAAGGHRHLAVGPGQTVGQFDVAPVGAFQHGQAARGHVAQPFAELPAAAHLRPPRQSGQQQARCRAAGTDGAGDPVVGSGQIGGGLGEIEDCLFNPGLGRFADRVHARGDPGGAVDAHAGNAPHRPVAGHRDVDGLDRVGQPLQFRRALMAQAGAAAGRQHRRPQAGRAREGAGEGGEDAGTEPTPAAGVDLVAQKAGGQAAGQGLGAGDDAVLTPEDLVEHEPMVLVRPHRGHRDFIACGLWITSPSLHDRVDSGRWSDLSSTRSREGVGGHRRPGGGRNAGCESG